MSASYYVVINESHVMLVGQLRVVSRARWIFKTSTRTY